MKKVIFTTLKLIFFLGIGVIFIWVFLRNLNPQQQKEIWHSFKEANYYWILLSLVFALISHLLRTLRWQLMVEPLGYKVSFINTMFSVMIGYFANLAIPRLGEVVRCGFLNKYEKVPFNKALGTVITERAIDVLTFLLIFIFTLLIAYKQLEKYIYDKIYIRMTDKYSSFEFSYKFIILIIFILVLIFIFLFIFNRYFKHTKFYIKIKEMLKGFWVGIKSLTMIKKPWLFVFLSLLIWLFYLLGAYICFFCFADTSHLGLDAALGVLAFGTIGIMLVQGGIGIYPFIVSEVLYAYSISITKSYSLGWLIWLSQTFIIIFAGIISLIMISVYNRRMK